VGDPEPVKEAFERTVRVLSNNDLVGRGTAVTTARLGDALSVDVEEGPWKFRVDMAPKAGGANTGPNPGVYGRGTLAACLAISYAMWAAYLDVTLRDLRIEVHADYDARGIYGVGEASPAYGPVRIEVFVDSPDPPERVRDMMRQAEDHCTYLKVWEGARTIPVAVTFAGETA